MPRNHSLPHTLAEKGTKAVTWAVPLKKVHFCTYICILIPKVYILYILSVP